LELLQLRYFLDCADNLSFAKAAKKHMVPSSSVSACIKRLENEMGCKLFDRAANSIKLNEQGIKLKRCLENILPLLDKTVYEIKNPSEDLREIKILVRALRSVMTEKIIKFKEENVNARFKLVSSFENHDFENYDIIMDTKNDRYDGYECIEVVRQPIKIFASKNSRFKGKKITLSELCDEPFANMSQQGRQYNLLCESCEKGGFTPKLVAQVNDYGCFIKIIESGVAVGAAGRESMKLAESSSIVELDVTDFKEEQTVCAYFKREKCYGNVQKFLGFLNSSLN